VEPGEKVRTWPDETRLTLGVLGSASPLHVYENVQLKTTVMRPKEKGTPKRRQACLINCPGLGKALVGHTLVGMEGKATDTEGVTLWVRLTAEAAPGEAPLAPPQPQQQQQQQQGAGQKRQRPGQQQGLMQEQLQGPQQAWQQQEAPPQEQLSGGKEDHGGAGGSPSPSPVRPGSGPVFSGCPNLLHLALLLRSLD
jgi:hypothetical protein